MPTNPPEPVDPVVLQATLESFGHLNDLSHTCESCRQLRQTGPKDDRCSLGKLVGSSEAAESARATETLDALLPKKEQRKRARQRLRAALKGEFAPVRRKAA